MLCKSRADLEWIIDMCYIRVEPIWIRHIRRVNYCNASSELIIRWCSEKKTGLKIRAEIVCANFILLLKFCYHDKIMANKHCFIYF